MLLIACLSHCFHRKPFASFQPSLSHLQLRSPLFFSFITLAPALPHSAASLTGPPEHLKEGSDASVRTLQSHLSARRPHGNPCLQYRLPLGRLLVLPGFSPIHYAVQTHIFSLRRSKLVVLLQGCPLPLQPLRLSTQWPLPERLLLFYSEPGSHDRLPVKPSGLLPGPPPPNLL